MEIFQCPPKERVIELLSGAGLPSSDIGSRSLRDFFGCGTLDAPDGIVGLELHGEFGLLRSLVVAGHSQNQGCGNALVSRVERHAAESGVTTLYLLTETAGEFFDSLGYEEVPRSMVPDPIRGTKEFVELCSANAAVMRKALSA